MQGGMEDGATMRDGSVSEDATGVKKGLANECGEAGGGGSKAALMYELYAVLVHSGSAAFGHYYALIKDLAHGEWHEFNDSSVRAIKESEVQRAWGAHTATGGWGCGSTSSAYMLLYRRKGEGSHVGACTAHDGTAPMRDANRGSSFPAIGQRLGGGHEGEPLCGASSPALKPDERHAAGQETKRLRLTPPRDISGDRASSSAGGGAFQLPPPSPLPSASSTTGVLPAEGQPSDSRGTARQPGHQPAGRTLL